MSGWPGRAEDPARERGLPPPNRGVGESLVQSEQAAMSARATRWLKTGFVVSRCHATKNGHAEFCVAIQSGRYWTRTSDLNDVNVAL